LSKHTKRYFRHLYRRRRK